MSFVDSNLVDVYTAIDPMAAKVGPVEQMIAYRPPTQTNYSFVSAQSPSSTNLTFNLTPSKGQFLSTGMIVEFSGKIRISCTTSASPAISWGLGTTCIRQFPLASISSTIQAQFNQVSVSLNSGKLMSMLGRALRYDDVQACDSVGVPDLMYLATDYALLTSDAAGQRNPGLKAPGQYNGVDSRGSFQYFITPVSGTANTVALLTGTGAAAAGVQVFDVSFTVREPVFLPALSGPAKCYHTAALVNIQQFQLTYNIEDIKRMFVFTSSTSVWDTLTLQDTPTAKLYYQTFYYPDSVIPIYDSVPYSYLTWLSDDFASAEGKISNNSLASYSVQNINVATLPDRFFIAVRETNATRGLKPDSFLPIENIKVQVNGQASILNGASDYQIYILSKKNGLQMSYSDWRLYGGPAIICPSDLGIASPDNVAVGGQMQTQVQFTIQVRYSVGTTPVDSITAASKAVSSDTAEKNCQAFVMVISPALMSISWANTTLTKGLFSKETVQMAVDNRKTLSIPDLEYFNYVSGGLIGGGSTMLGGSVWSWIGDRARNVYDFGKSAVSKGLDVGKSIYGVAKDVIPVASDVLKFAAQQGVPLAAQASQGLSAVRGITGLGAKSRKGRGIADLKFVTPKEMTSRLNKL